jgi:ABC-type Fe3+-siderophore transport system permease subunit
LTIYLCTFTAPEQYIWFALAGALIAGLVAFGVSSIGGWKASPLSLVLAGTAVTEWRCAAGHYRTGYLSVLGRRQRDRA